MGHLPIVNRETIQEIISSGYIGVRGDLNKNWIKTSADIFSDVLATRKGDLIFPWIVNSEGGSNMGFKYVFKVSGDPIFVGGEKYPVKIPLEKEGLVFDKPVSEAEALDLWRSKLLWNAIGKKSLGRGRSLTHQTMMEDNILIELLKSKNKKEPTKILLAQSTFEHSKLQINPSQNRWDEELKDKISRSKPENRLSQFNLSGIPWRKNKLFAVEKVLEAWIMQNIDKKACEELRKIIFDDYSIEWFGNYLPFGVQGSNMDIVLIQSANNKKRVTLIELKVGTLNQKQFESAADQSIDYALFMKRALNSFGFEVELNPIVLAGPPKRNASPRKYSRENLEPKWVAYGINPEGEVNFEDINLAQ